MFRHVVVFRFDPATTAAEKQAIADGLRTLPATIAELRDYHVGPDAGINDGNFDFAVVADFDNQADYLVYRDHPAHQKVIAERITGHISERAAVQYEV